MLKSLFQQAFQLFVLLLEGSISAISLRYQAVKCIEIFVQFFSDVLSFTLHKLDVGLGLDSFHLFKVV